MTITHNKQSEIDRAYDALDDLTGDLISDTVQARAATMAGNEAKVQEFTQVVVDAVKKIVASGNSHAVILKLLGDAAALYVSGNDPRSQKVFGELVEKFRAG